MIDVEDLNIVVAGVDRSGKEAFLEPSAPARYSLPAVAECTYIWSTENVPDLSKEMGSPARGVDFPPPGGSRFALFCLAANSAGKMDLNGTAAHQHLDIDPGNAAMHRSNSIDYEIVISGKVDIVLKDGTRRVLTPGSCLIMGGVAHAWENHYSEPCVYAAVMIGARDNPSIQS